MTMQELSDEMRKERARCSTYCGTSKGARLVESDGEEIYEENNETVKM